MTITTKKSLWIIAFTISSLSVFAQDQPAFKNDIGFSTNFIIQQVYPASQAPFSVMYKKYNKPDRPLRLGFDASIDVANSSGNNNPQDSYSDQENISLTLIFGKEFQKSITRHWVWYWGMDMSPMYSRYKSESYRDGEKINSYENTNYGVSIKPLAGFRYNINDRLYLSVEANASLSIRTFENRSVQYSNEVVTTQHTDGTAIAFGFVPASGLFLFYKF